MKIMKFEIQIILTQTILFEIETIIELLENSLSKIQTSYRSFLSKIQTYVVITNIDIVLFEMQTIFKT